MYSKPMYEQGETGFWSKVHENLVLGINDMSTMWPLNPIPKDTVIKIRRLVDGANEQ